MKFYMSYWSKPKTDNSIDITKNSYKNTKYMMEKSLSFLKQYYKDIFFYTDYKGEEIFGDLGWSEVNTSLESLPKEYYETWSLGKLFTFQMACNLGDPFIHMDYDIFISRPFRDDILSSEVLVESQEMVYGYGYNRNYFYKKCKNRFFAQNLKSDFAYTTGLFGGRNLDFIYKYASSAYKMAICKENSDFFLKPNKEHLKENLEWKMFAKASLIEQYYLYICCKYFKIDPTIFWKQMCPDLFDKDRFFYYSPIELSLFDRTGYIHFLGDYKRGFVFDKKIIDYQI